MPERDPTATERRIAELERRVAELELRLTQRAAARVAPVPTRPPNRTASGHPGEPTAGGGRWSGEAWFRSGEGWLGRAGVALVVFGLIFLFRYAVDRGWLTPELRVTIGLLVGGGMLGAGAVLFPGRDRYRQILMAGGLVVLFLTGLAASELYGLIRGGIALLFHGAVAAVGFMAASRRRDTMLASIAALGGLVPPAFLLADTVAGPVLWLYLALLAAWTAVLVSRHEPGPFAVLAAAAAALAMFRDVPDGEPLMRATAVLMLAAVWFGFAALPLLRSTLTWTVPLQPDERALWMRFGQPPLVAFAAATALQETVWPGTYALEGGFAAALVGFAALAAVLYPRRQAADGAGLQSLQRDDFSAAAAASVVFMVGLCLTVPPLHYRVPAVAAVAAAAYFAAPRLRARALAMLAHVLFAGVALALVNRLETLRSLPAFDVVALTSAAAVVFAAAVMGGARSRREQVAYGAGIFAAVHALLATELSAVPHAPWLASASYAVVGALLVVYGLTRQNVRVQQAGMLSLALLVLRLFAFDLANVDTGVRIVLFLACGFGFLALSYLFRGRRALAE